MPEIYLTIPLTFLVNDPRRDPNQKKKKKHSFDKKNPIFYF